MSGEDHLSAPRCPRTRHEGDPRQPLLARGFLDAENRLTPEGVAMPERDRPSRHGAILGEALARIEAEGRKSAPGLPDCCATCAFRPGCMTNMMAATGLTALNVLLGIDGDSFACHHGMKDGEPTKICAGYAAAQLASFDFVMAEIAAMHAALGEPPPRDVIRAEFDEWISRVDPDDALDDYARGRLFLRERPFTVAHGNTDRSDHA